MRKLFLIVILLLVALAPRAFATATVSFRDEVLPLLEQRPDVLEPLLRDFDLGDRGVAVRIGSHICPALAGTRMPPYEFEAYQRADPYAPYVVTVNTDVDFFDTEGLLVFRVRDGMPDEDDSAFHRAVSYRETFSSLRIREAPSL